MCGVVWSSVVSCGALCVLALCGVVWHCRALDARYTWIKARDMLAYYPQDKVNDIVKRRTDKGVFKVDVEFPQDVTERRYPILTADTYASSKAELERIKGTGVVDCDSDMAAGLFGEGGLLSSGTRVGIDGVSDCGAVAFLQQVEPELDLSKIPNKPKAPPPTKATEVHTVTLKEEMATVAYKVLKEVGEARGYSLSLQPFEVPVK